MYAYTESIICLQKRLLLNFCTLQFMIGMYARIRTTAAEQAKANSYLMSERMFATKGLQNL